MSHDADLAALSLIGVAHLCQQETERFFQHIKYDTRYCFELFRRAIVERIDLAWALIHTQYSAQVFSWIKQHAGFTACGEDAAYFANRGFEKMWSAMTADKFANFHDVNALLQYMKLCVHSVITDYLRSKNRPSADASLPLDEINARLSDAGTEAITLDKMASQELWALIQKRLNNEREEQLLYYRFVLDLKPSEICERFPAEFPTVHEIYLMLQYGLARLRRSAELQKFLGESD